MKQVVFRLQAFSFLFALVVLLAATPAAHAQSLSPNLLTFTSTAVTNNSAAKPLTLTNSGTAAMSVSVSMIGGDFDQTNNCGTSLASKKSCTINVVFNPTGTGTRAAILEVRAGNSFQLALLAGTAIPQVTLSATSMTFASQVVGAASAAQAVSMKNNQNIAMPVTGVTITGDYTQTNNCGSSLAAGATCTLSVIFKPSAAGTRTGLLSVKDNAVSNPEDVTLTGTATAATVKSIAVTPATISIVKGKTQQFTAVVTYTNNTTADVTSTATWTSSSAAIATVTKGLATGVAAGSATMTVSMTGTTITGKSTLTVTVPTLVSIAVTPNPVSVVKGKTQQFSASGTYSDGTTAALTTATWSSTTGATITSSGLATASAVGAPVIKATSGTISGSATMTVTPATLVSIAVTPATATIAKGKTQQFTATGTYTDNTTQNLTATATWTSLTGASVTGGLATGTAVGAPVVTATSGTISGNATLTVQAAALVSIAVTPSTAAINKGLRQQFAATGTYTDGTTAAVAVTWSSTANASVATTGLATGTAVGSSTITGTSGIIKGTAALTVNPAALVSIAVTPATASVAKGLTQQYAATGTYTDATTQNLTATAVWTSAAGATVAPGGLATATAVGTPSITATSGAISGAAVMTVQPAALVSFSVSPSAASIARGTTQAFTAQGSYTDTTVADITSTVTWSATSGATIAPTGIATATVIGNTTITASFNSMTSSAALSVVPPALTAITVTPGSASLGLHGQQQFNAMGTFADSTTQDLTSTVVWTSGNPSLVSITAGGFAKVLGTSSSAIPVTASSSGITSNPAWLSAVAELPPFCSSPTIDMKLLVITNGKTEADFGAIKQTLDYLGTPYDVLDMTVTPTITAAMLSDGNCHGYYQGVIYTFGNWMYVLNGASTDLLTYEQTYHVRQLNWFVYPDPNFGLNSYNSQIPSTATYSANFTPAADQVFTYANTATPLAFANASIYLSTPVGTGGTSLPSGASVTPLLTDSAGNALSILYTPGDGREFLSQTFDSNQYLKHNLVVSYGLINWVTRGVFLGQYHIYAAGQVDDFFINDAEWVPGTPCSNSTTHDRTVSDDPSLPTYRLKLADMTALSAWQNGLQNDPLLKGFKLTLAFNGIGTTGNNDWTGVPVAGAANDDLVSGLSSYEKFFHWVTHTYDHPNTLNGLHKSDVGGDSDTPQMDSIDLEILTNLFVASAPGGVNLDPTNAVKPLHFTDFNPAVLISPGVTGLNDAVVPQYLYADGIRYAVSDTSVIGQTNNGPNPSPNVGIVNSYAPGIYEVPRYPNSIYYNAANWQDDEAEFHCIYGPDPGPAQTPYDSYVAADILNYTTDTFVNNMLKGDMDPQMFHQPNLHAYDGSNSMISDVYNQTFAKYEALFKLPVLSLTIDQLGESMKARNIYNLSGVTASLTNYGSADASVTITMPAAATVPTAVIPVTGLSSNGSEVYGGQNISHVPVNAGDTIALPMQ